VPRVGEGDSERYWDERARENALFYVDNRLDYDDPDGEAFWSGGDEVLDQMLDLVGLAIGAGETVVDIGCGVGRLTRALAGRARHVYGVDVSSEMLARAREHNADLDNVEWLHGDGRGLSVVGDGAVDGCLSHVVFQHIPDPAITLGYVGEMGRVLRPGGWSLFQVSTNPEVHRRPGGIRARAKALAGRRSDAAWWGSAVDPGTLRVAADEAGLDIEQLLGEGSQFTTVLARRRSPIASR
jgi:SAM-dependent methyltransferase